MGVDQRALTEWTHALFRGGPVLIDTVRRMVHNRSYAADRAEVMDLIDALALAAERLAPLEQAAQEEGRRIRAEHEAQVAAQRDAMRQEQLAAAVEADRRRRAELEAAVLRGPAI